MTDSLVDYLMPVRIDEIGHVGEESVDGDVKDREAGPGVGFRV